MDINEELFARITDALSFESRIVVANIEKLMPNNCVVTALVLVDMNTLCVVRVEKGVEPILYKLKYEQRFSDEFKQIIAENDLSMKMKSSLKFWKTRKMLNQWLAAFSEELDNKVLSFACGLLLGSFTLLGAFNASIACTFLFWGFIPSLVNISQVFYFMSTEKRFGCIDFKSSIAQSGKHYFDFLDVVVQCSSSDD